ncbi:MAG: Si-specific NAD(P)(+) transhydrogenase [Planctomycetota bacterium]
MRSYDLICIGSGPAGESAAVQAAKFGRRAAIVECAPRPGGAMVNTGTVASKVLRETALVASALRRRPIPGCTTDPLRELSMQRFMARRTLVQMEEHDRIEERLDLSGVEILRGRGEIVDMNTVRVVRPDGSMQLFTTDFMLVATGSVPARAKTVDFTHPAVVDADGILSLERMPRSLVVVGAGVIGSEYASIFAELGVSVTLVEPRSTLMRFLDEEIRAVLERGMREQGIELLFNTSAARIEGTAEGRARTVLSDGREMVTDCALWSLGRNGNTRGLGLESVGVKPDDRGLVAVDTHYRTDCPTVFAAGDVIGFPALASTSMEQGRIAACHMFGIPFLTRLADTVPIGIYTIPAVASVGLTEEQARSGGRDVVIGRGHYRDNARGRMLGDDQGLLKAVFDRNTRALIGVSIAGEDATELVHLGQQAIAAGHGIQHLVESCFNYPSLTELYKTAAFDALAQLGADGLRLAA